MGDKKKAVICDDDRVLTMVLETLAARAGFSASVGEDGEEGLSLVRAQDPDLLILDIEMPVKDGLSVLRDLQSAAQRPYIIVLSALENPQTKKLVLELGADEMMIKPFTPSALLQRLEALLQEGKI